VEDGQVWFHVKKSSDMSQLDARSIRIVALECDEIPLERRLFYNFPFLCDNLEAWKSLGRAIPSILRKPSPYLLDLSEVEYFRNSQPANFPMGWPRNSMPSLVDAACPRTRINLQVAFVALRIECHSGIGRMTVSISSRWASQTWLQAL
jgi:hypothetical protein